MPVVLVPPITSICCKQVFSIRCVLFYFYNNVRCYMRHTHEILRTLREEHNYRQDYIAKYLGITQQTYSNYELGLREIPLHHIIKLSHLYQISTDYLLGVGTCYAGSTDLSQEYLDNISLHDLIYDIQRFDAEQKKTLVQFVRFLKER